MIAIVKYNAGNVCSVVNALQRLGYAANITDNPEEIERADHVIFPGVGAAKPAMQYLQKQGLEEVLKQCSQPVLGICLGLQLLCAFSEEGNTPGLGVFSNQVLQFPSGSMVPHMGWNNFEQTNGVLLRGITPNDNVYYVHSYCAEVSAESKGICAYAGPFSATLEKDNFFATQFHPEKSGKVGEQILRNFLSL